MMNIDEMSAGRELDTLIAEKVMGWTGEPIIRDDGHDCNSTIWLEPREGFESLEWTGYVSRLVPGFRGELRCKNKFGGITTLGTDGIKWNPSTRIDIAWKVVEKIKELHNVCLMLEDFQFDGRYWEACFKDKFNKDEGKWTKLDYAFADTPELAICRAALKAVTE